MQNGTDKLTPWKPSRNVSRQISLIAVKDDSESLRFIFSLGKLHPFLIVKFDSHLAYCKSNETYTEGKEHVEIQEAPFFTVEDSSWLQLLARDSSIDGDAFTHFVILAETARIDVIAANPPNMRWHNED